MSDAKRLKALLSIIEKIQAGKHVQNRTLQTHLTEEEQSAIFAYDSRPNHIADMQVHANIFNTVNAVIQGTKTGILYLDL